MNVSKQTRDSYRLEGREVPAEHVRSPDVQEYLDGLKRNVRAAMSECGICLCGHALSQHEFYTQTLHGCKGCPDSRSCTYFRPAIGGSPVVSGSGERLNP